MKQQIAIIGAMGSGKTVFTTVWAHKLSQSTTDIYIHPSNRPTENYVSRVMETLHKGDWVDSTRSGEKQDLVWYLHDGKNYSYPVRMSDVSGQDLVRYFSDDELYKSENLDAHDKEVLDYIRASSIVIITIDMLQIFESGIYSRKRADIQGPISEFLRMYADENKCQDIALLFTGYDRCREQCEQQFGSFQNWWQTAIPNIYNAARNYNAIKKNRSDTNSDSVVFRISSTNSVI